MRTVVSTLSHCAFLRTISVRHKVVSALSALEANDPWEEVVVCRSELSKVLLAECLSHTPGQQGLHHLGPEHAHL